MEMPCFQTLGEVRLDLNNKRDHFMLCPATKHVRISRANF